MVTEPYLLILQTMRAKYPGPNTVQDSMAPNNFVSQVSTQTQTISHTKAYKYILIPLFFVMNNVCKFVMYFFNRTKEPIAHKKAVISCNATS